MSNEPADAPAWAAFSVSRYDWSHYGEAETAHATGVSHHGIAAPQQSPVTQTIAPVHFGSNESSTVDHGMMTSSASHMEQSGRPWAVPNHTSLTGTIYYLGTIMECSKGL